MGIFNQQVFLTIEDLPQLKNNFYPTAGGCHGHTEEVLIEEHKTRYNNRNIYGYVIDLIEDIDGSEITSVMDFGGNKGISYFLWKEKFKIWNYAIVEQKTFCEGCQKYWRDKKYPINYYRNILEIDTYIDLIYSRSGVQYHQDYLKFFQQCVDLHPKYIIFDYCYFSHVPSHFRIQNFSDHNIPIHFTNIDETIEFMKNHNYDLLKLEGDPDYRHSLKIEDPVYSPENIYNISFKKK